ncbi:MAG: inositol monophosphatase [Ignavibacteria bacterium]|nr:inositol monophosphatase [Ignavibacteria bacterium]
MKNDQLLTVAKHAALTAGAILMEGYGKVIDVRFKDGTHNIVTDYDIKCESEIKRILLEAVPNSSFLGEESIAHVGAGNVEWIVDPLDGTVNYAHGIPIFCVSIAAKVDNQLVAGVIFHPVLGELFTCSLGQGAFLNDIKINVSSTQTLQESMLVTGFPYSVNSNPKGCIDQFAALVGRGLPIRRLGSAALDLAYTAAGRFDGYWEVSLQPWDMAAGVLLLTEAGGQVTHYDGKQFVLSSNSIVATNSIIHNELVAALTGFEA